MRLAEEVSRVADVAGMKIAKVITRRATKKLVESDEQGFITNVKLVVV